MINFYDYMKTNKETKGVYNMSKLANTPKPPYYSVIFTSQRTDGDNGYEDTSDRMLQKAAEIDGFIGVESLRNEEGFGITVTYWKSLESINVWRNHMGHMEAKKKGREMWYSKYMIRICKIERDNYFEV